MPIKSRADIYGMESAELLREITMYPGVNIQQLHKFHPGKEDKISNLLSHLTKQGRIARKPGGGYFPTGKDTPSQDRNLPRAVWVLLDFIDRVEFHCVSDFPVSITFFADGEVYEIVYAAYGQEVLVSQVMKSRKDQSCKRIVMIDALSQMSALDFPGITGYCTVDSPGNVHYYKKPNGGR